MNPLVPTTASTSTDPQPDEWRFEPSRGVHTSSREHDEPLVAVIAEGLAAVAVPWELATGRSPDQRKYELILSTDLYDAWLIHWPAATGLDAHDHGGSTGAIAIERNVLEWRLDPTSHHRHPAVASHDGELVVFCQEGYASSLAVGTLGDLGVPNVHDLAGGYAAWVAAGLPVEREEFP